MENESLNFEKIPSVTDLAKEKPELPTVAEELAAARKLLATRKTKCEAIRPAYKRPRIRAHKYAWKFFCVCPRYQPHYCCKHIGNIVIDRDVLTKEEHICYLATPKQTYAARRLMPRFFHKRVIVPGCTPRIEQLAQPDVNRVRTNLESFQHVLKKRQFRAMQKALQPKPEIPYMNLNVAISYMEEEMRLQRVQRRLENRRCKRIKKQIIAKQRKQIKKIICVLFEEMKEFLLNDQFLIDDESTLCAVLLEQIREFTDKDFYTTSNLREYQHVLANNVTVWINKFISNLNIQVAPPVKRTERPEPETFLPVSDYISTSEPQIEDEVGTTDGMHGEDMMEEGFMMETTEATIKN